MSIRNLDHLFQPRSVALIGASNRPHSVGNVVMKNLLSGGFKGPIWPVNPKHDTIEDLEAFADVNSLPEAPDLAVICTPPNTVPALVDALGKRGTKAAVIMTAGVDEQAMLNAARPHLLRIVGHNCVGILVPEIGLNASFAPTAAKSGKIAFVSQSGALCTAILDWSTARGIGFSHFISLGNAADVDFGDTVDWLARDDETASILLYIESITHARKFISACRAASRTKPIVAIKAGRNAEGAKAAASHTGALAGRDDVYDAAFARAGVLRVGTAEELFDAVETLARARPLGGEDLVIVTNGGGLGVLAADMLTAENGHLARLSDETIHALNRVLPKTWSQGNPVDIIGDAPGSRYGEALEVLLKAPEADAFLIMHAPTGITQSDEVAEGVVAALSKTRKTVLANWMGGRVVARAKDLLEEANIPSFDTPVSAVRGFMQLVKRNRLQANLLETPPAIPAEFEPDSGGARSIIRDVLEQGRDILTEVEAKNVLDSYGIPIVETRIVRDADEAGALAEEIGFPVAVKILSPDISHKSDVGGVSLNLKSRSEMVEAVETMRKRVGDIRPEARITGFTVQQMVQRSTAHELLIGAFVDDIFGPTLMFGQGGTAVEVIADRAVALPPLNMVLARRLIEETRISRLLAGYRDRPAADLEAIQLTLFRISQLVCDIAEIAELDINPLLADDEGVIALDARIIVRKSDRTAIDRLAIRPYPSQLVEEVETRSGMRVLLRPIRPEDELAHADFVSHLDSQDVRYRFFGMIKHPDHVFLARLTQIDYDREMSFIATPLEGEMAGETLGVVRTITDPDNERAEYAIIIRSDMKGQGLGYVLMQKMIAYTRTCGTRELFGLVMGDNQAMRSMASNFGFETRRGPEPGIVEMVLSLG